MRPYWERDGISIYHGDALEVMADMPDGSVSIIHTDPPYSSGARQAAQLRSRKGMTRATHNEGDWIATDNLTAHGFTMLVRLFAVEALRLVPPGGHLFSFIDWRQWPILAGAIESAGWGLRACLVWDKVHFGMGNGFRQQAEFILHASHGTADNFLRHDLGTVFRESRQFETEHPTGKPPGAVEQMLSAVPGEVVMDPFMGSGTVLDSARALGRRAIGVDSDERWCEGAARRLSQEVFSFPEETPAP